MYKFWIHVLGFLLPKVWYKLVGYSEGGLYFRLQLHEEIYHISDCDKT